MLRVINTKVKWSKNLRVLPQIYTDKDSVKLRATMCPYVI